MPVLIRALVLLILTASLSGCGYNAIQQKEEGVKAGWSEVLNQYQRRADLIPNLVRTVQGYAQQERQVLTEVTNARARVGQIQVNADDEASLKQFQQAQGELGSALSRLLVVSENYPQLKSDQSFRDLQVQLEGTEKPHHRGARPLYPDRAGLQHVYPVVPAGDYGEDVWVSVQAEFQRGKRSADLARSTGGFR